MTQAADKTVEDGEVSTLRCLSFFGTSPPGILKRINLRGPGTESPVSVPKSPVVTMLSDQHLPTHRIISRQSSRRNPVLKPYCKLLIRQSPVMHRHSPLLRNLPDTHIDDLPDRIISREHCLGFRELSHHPMVTFNSVGRIYYLPYFRRIFEESRKLIPVPVP